jgi:DNA-binding response OmpR family regulator
LADLGAQIIGLTQQTSEPITSPEHTSANQPKQDETGAIVVGDIRLETLTGRVIVRGEEIALSNVQYKLLQLLMERSNRLVSPQEILELVYHERSDDYFSRRDDARISTLIARLRSNVDPEGKYIKNVRGLGYRLDFQ